MLQNPDYLSSKTPSQILRTLGTLTWGSYAQTKPLLLLAYLVLEGPTSQHRLLQLFWPEVTSAENSFRVSRCMLKKQGVEMSQQGELWSANLYCDAAHLLECHGWDAVQLGGLFLDGVRLQGVSAEFREWVDTQRERLALHVQRELLKIATICGEKQAYALAERAWAIPGAPVPDAVTLARVLAVCQEGSALHAQVQTELLDCGWSGEHLVPVPGQPHPMAFQALLAWWLDGGVAWLTGPASAGKSVLAQQFCGLLRQEGLPVLYLDALPFLNDTALLVRLRQMLHASASFSSLTIVLDHLDHLDLCPAALEGLSWAESDLRFLCVQRNELRNSEGFWLKLPADLTAPGQPAPLQFPGQRRPLRLSSRCSGSQHRAGVLARTRHAPPVYGSPWKLVAVSPAQAGLGRFPNVQNPAILGVHDPP